MRRSTRNTWLIFLLFFSTISSFSQQALYKWRIGIGSTVYTNVDAASSSFQNFHTAIDENEFNYSFYLEHLLSESWATNLSLDLAPSDFHLAAYALSFTYFTDNRHLLGRRRFVSPFLSLGIGNDVSDNKLFIPASIGLKFRFHSRVNLNLSYHLKSYVEEWSSLKTNGWNSLNGAFSVSLHYNLIKRKQTFTAPSIYASGDYDYGKEILLPVVSDTLVLVKLSQDTMQLKQAHLNADLTSAFLNTQSFVEHDTLITLTYVDGDSTSHMDTVSLPFDLLDSIMYGEIMDSTFDATIYWDSFPEDSSHFYKVALDSANLGYSLFVPDSISSKPDSIVLDLILNTTQHIEPVLNIVTPVKAGAMPYADTLSLGLALEKYTYNQAKFISDSIAVIVNTEKADTVLRVLKFRMDTLIVPVRIDLQMQHADGSPKLYSAEDLTHYAIADNAKIVDTARAAVEDNRGNYTTNPQDSFENERRKNYELVYGKAPVNNVVSSKNHKQENLSNGDLYHLHARIDSIVNYLKKDLENQQRLQEINRLKSITEIQQREQAFADKMTIATKLTTPILVPVDESRAPELALNTVALASPSLFAERDSQQVSQTSVDELIVSELSSSKTPQTDTLNWEEKYRRVENEVEALRTEIKELVSQVERLSNKETPFTNTYEDYIKLRNDVAALKIKLNLQQQADFNSKKVAPSLDVNYAKTNIYFATNSTVVKGNELLKLIELVKYIKENKEAKILLKGYTDKSGSSDYNLLLSGKRIASVVEILGDSNIHMNRIQTESCGIDTTLTAPHQSFGRRVEILLSK